MSPKGGFVFDDALTLARRAWRTFPVGARRAVGRRALRALAPRPDRKTPLGPGDDDVVVAGFFRNSGGIGEGARLCADEMFRLSGREVRRADLSSLLSSADLDGAPPFPRVAGKARGGAVVLHVNPPLVPHSLFALGRRVTREHRLIGHWVWELPRAPVAWAADAVFLDEIWVPSAFCADAVRPLVDKPIRVVPYPVSIPVPSAATRADFGLPDDRLIVLSMLHFGSGFTRKNPIGAIRAFRRAFGNDADVLLVVKVTENVPLPWAEAELAEAVAGADNVVLKRGTLSPSDLAALIARSDVLLSPHRSEGFGLVPAEAMRLGKPVIATGWSGNLEFMDDASAALLSSRLIPVVDPGNFYDPGQFWADPDLDEAADWLRRLRDDPELRRRLGEAGRVQVERRLGGDAFARAVGRSIPGVGVLVEGEEA